MLVIKYLVILNNQLVEVSEYISAVIITYNEAHNIEDCIKSLKKVCNEIVVVDSESDDNTMQLAKALGAITYNRSWKSYGDQKNFGATKAANNWILSIDADERLECQLSNAISCLKLNEQVVYGLNVKTNYLGKWIKHCGWYPNFKKRLYNKNQARWSEDLVHENLVSDKKMKVVKLKGDLLHYSYPTLEIHHKKTEQYAKLTAQKWILKKRAPGILKKLLGPSFRFFRTYILKLGFLDGREGYKISQMSALLVRKQLQYYAQLKKTN